MVSGVGTVWIIVKSESPLINDGYRLVGQCFNRRHLAAKNSKSASSAKTFRVVLLADNETLRDARGNVVVDDDDLLDSSRHKAILGQTLVDTLRMRSTADHVMLAVDEMIWLRPVDLRRVARVLQLCDSNKVGKMYKQAERMLPMFVFSFDGACMGIFASLWAMCYVWKKGHPKAQRKYLLEHVTDVCSGESREDATATFSVFVYWSLK